jgi:DNA-binding GntR family transcriptional regulator
MRPVDQPQSLVQQTYDILEDAICNGRLRPGERLTQDDIATRLNVSRQPVNAAFAMLKANRLVESTGRRGVVVAPLDLEFFRDIYDFRGVVEPLAVILCGARPVDSALKTEGMAIIAEGRAARSADDVPAMVRADVAFHGLLYRMSGNRVIEETMRVYWAHIRRAMKEILGSAESYPDTVWDQHERIFNAILAGQSELAAEILRTHLLGSFAAATANRPAARDSGKPETAHPARPKPSIPSSYQGSI